MVGSTGINPLTFRFSVAPGGPGKPRNRAKFRGITRKFGFVESRRSRWISFKCVSLCRCQAARAWWGS